jgi:Tfp pilus assembly protein PilN
MSAMRMTAKGSLLRRGLIAWAVLASILSVSAKTAPSLDELRAWIEKDRPGNVVIAVIGFQHEIVTVEGTSVSPNAVANFAENIKADKRFTLPENISIREQPDTTPRTYEYKFTFRLRSE